jgi:(E)-4-hydroxy-3-methylbut-2-enyl-diphosphate synthase
VAKKLVEYMPRGIASLKPEKQTGYEAPSEKPGFLNSIRGPLVVANMTHFTTFNPKAYNEAGYTADKDKGTFVKSDGGADLIISSHCPEVIPERVSMVIPYKIWFSNREKERVYPLFSPETYYENAIRSEKLNVVLTGSHFNIAIIKQLDPANCLLIFTFNPEKERYAPDVFMNTLEENDLHISIILNPVFSEDGLEDIHIKAASLLGGYINDRRISGISIINRGDISFRDINSLCFSILQCTGTRITRNMYLSCPTCGRTKFDLQEAVKKVKKKTGHLKGLKIAVMGCIVNGPGEMADADWGYVGAAKGKVHIYKGTIPVLKNVPEKDAADELVRLIEEDQASL